MEWVRLWVGIRDHPKVLGLSDGGHRLYVNTLAWVGEHETDGDIATRLVVGNRYVDELVTAGLWERGEDGALRVHDWGQWQETRDDLDARRNRGSNAARTRWSNARRTAASDASGSPPSNASRTPSGNGNKDTDTDTERTPSAFDSDATGLAELLADLVEGNGFKRPKDLTAWTGDLERALRIDHVDAAEMKDVMLWALSDNFWRRNIQSAIHFRMEQVGKYNRLRLQWQDEREKDEPKHDPSNDLPRMA